MNIWMIEETFLQTLHFETHRPNQNHSTCCSNPFQLIKKSQNAIYSLGKTTFRFQEFFLEFWERNFVNLKTQSGRISFVNLLFDLWNWCERVFQKRKFYRFVFFVFCMILLKNLKVESKVFTSLHHKVFKKIKNSVSNTKIWAEKLTKEFFQLSIHRLTVWHQLANTPPVVLLVLELTLHCL